MTGVATASASSEQREFSWIQEAHTFLKKAVGVAAKICIFIKVPHDLFQVTTADEND